MMRALGNFMLAGRMQAVMAISLLTVAALSIPPFSYLIGGAPAGLLILRKAPAYSLQVMLLCLMAVVIFVAALGVNPQIALAFALGIWIPVYLCCSTLKLTESQGWLVFTAGTMAVIYVLIMHSVIDDVPAWWLSWLELWLEQTFSGGEGEQYRKILEQAAPAMNAMMASGITISLVATTLLSRWWQSLLFNPGGFRSEFFALRLPPAIIVLSLAGIILLFSSRGAQGSAGLDILVVVIVMYLFQGLATVHRIVTEKKLPLIWLIVMYFLLVFVPQAVLLVACLGLVDSWIQRSKQEAKEQDKNNPEE